MSKILWTDGSVSPNPGPGGYAVIEDGRPVRVGREKESSNIRMEGAALIAAMEYAGKEGAKIVTDSQFWVNVLTHWAEGWKMHGWKKSSGEIKNLEMVKLAYKLYTENPIRLEWTRGHIGTEMNERADEWANKAREGFELEDSSEVLKKVLRES